MHAIQRGKRNRRQVREASPCLGVNQICLFPSLKMYLIIMCDSFLFCTESTKRKMYLPWQDKSVSKVDLSKDWFYTIPCSSTFVQNGKWKLTVWLMLYALICFDKCALIPVTFQSGQGQHHVKGGDLEKM